MTRFQLPDGPALVSAPPSLGPTFLQMDIMAACSLAMIPFVLIIH